MTRLINQYLGFLLCLLPQVVSAAQRPVGAAEMSDRLKFYSSIHEFAAKFRQIKHLKDMGVDLKSEGRVQVVRPDQVIWEIMKPSHVTVKIDKSRVEIVSGNGPEKTVQSLKLEDLPHDKAAGGIGLLLPWLTLDAKRLSTDYKIFEVEKKSFRFEPQAAASGLFEKIEIQLDDSGFLRRLQLMESSGDSLDIDFDEPTVKKR